MNLSEINKQWARILFNRGKTQKYIAQSLGVVQSTVSNLKKKEDWDNDILPTFTRGELVENAEELIFRCQLALLTGEEEDFTRGVLNHAKLAESLNKLEEGNEAVSTRNKIESVIDINRWHAEKGKAISAESLQEYHDEKVGEL